MSHRSLLLRLGLRVFRCPLRRREFFLYDLLGQFWLRRRERGLLIVWLLWSYRIFLDILLERVLVNDRNDRDVRALKGLQRVEMRHTKEEDSYVWRGHQLPGTCRDRLKAVLRCHR